MAKLISAQIDLSKIDRSKIKEGSNGQKYYNITISLNDSVNQWGQDTSIWTEQTKEQREANDKKSYIGNGKTIWSSEPKQAASQFPHPAEDLQQDYKDDLPF